MLSETLCIQIKRRMFPTCCIFIISLSKYAEWNCPYTENSLIKTVCMPRIRGMHRNSKSQWIRSQNWKYFKWLISSPDGSFGQTCLKHKNSSKCTVPFMRPPSCQFFYKLSNNFRQQLQREFQIIWQMSEGYQQTFYNIFTKKLSNTPSVDGCKSPLVS